jgi:STE24 endopeptidase
MRDADLYVQERQGTHHGVGKMQKNLILIAILALLMVLFAGYSSVKAEPAGMDSSAATLSKAATTSSDSGIIIDAQGKVVLPPMSEKAAQRYLSGNVLWVVDTLLGFLIPLLFLFTGFSAKIRDWAKGWGKKWFFTIVLYFAIFTLVNFIITLPLSYYEEFVREHAYGLSNQTLAKWLGDSLKSILISIVTGGLIIWMPYLLLKKIPKRWWLYTGLGAIPIFFFFIMIAPIWISPLFNDFGPMKDKALETRILTLADRAGIEGARVFEVNKSIDTKTVNAYVTGFAGTKRIVLWDTILQKLSPDQVLFVMGHEMGHYVMHHIFWTVMLLSILTIIALWVVHRSTGYFIKKYQSCFGFTELADIASLPLLLFVFSLVMFFATPMMNAYSRYLEHESDRFGLEITQNNLAGATAFVKLQTENLANPRPGWLYKLWRSDHPPIGERVDFMNNYTPWKTGQPLKYAHRFKAVVETPSEPKRTP